jgi:anaerobic selenocysteine-containing dehydrogenase
MKLLDRLAVRLGVGTNAEGYTYGTDERFGPMAESHRPDHWVRTTCGYCSVGCGMLVGVRDGVAVTVRGDPDHPVNEGRLCPKGLSEHLAIATPNRLTTPTLHGEPISWPTAIDTLVGGIERITAEHGPGSFAVLSTGQLVTEEFYALGKLVRLGLGLTNYDGNTTLCMASAVSGYKASFGSDGPPGSYADLTEADVVVLIGANIADNHPLLLPKLLANRDATVIVIDPRVTKTAMLADVHLALKPRTDVQLLNGLIRFCIDKGAIDTAFVAEHTVGFDELVAHVAPNTMAETASTCGVDEVTLEAAALAIAGAERLCIAWTMGVNHSVQGTETVTLINTLAAIRGQIGRPGSGPMSITGQCNAMGTRETGFTASMPGYRSFDNPQDRQELANLWGVSADRLPTARGAAYPDIINGIINGKIKGLWVIGTNPVVSFPNRELIEYALDKLDLLVVQDGYSTPSTERGHLVLPAAVWGEKEGTYTNSERRVSRVRAAVAPPGEARSDFDIFMAVAERTGMRAELFPGWTGPQHAFDEWRRVSAGRPCDYSGISYDRIDAYGGVQWPAPMGDDAVDGAGTRCLYADGRFNTPDGRARLAKVSPVAISDKPRPRYPFLLNTGRTVEHWHTRTKTGQVGILERLAPSAWIEIHPLDAAALGVSAGEPVAVRSERGAVEGIAVRVTAGVRQGEVFPFHYDEACANRLTMNEFDPISREPNYKQCAVAIERLPLASSAGRRGRRSH